MKIYQEKLRPKEWNDLKGFDKNITGGMTQKQALQRMAETGECFCIIFVGPPGCGKTSAAYLFSQKYLGVSSLESSGDFNIWNVSGERGIGIFREEITDVAKTPTFTNKRRIILLEEADGMTHDAKGYFKGLSEETSGNVIWILTMNNIRKFLDEDGSHGPIMSRSAVIEVDPSSFTEFNDWFTKSCQFCSIKTNPGVAQAIYEYYKGDMRWVISDFMEVYHDSIVTIFRPKKSFADDIFNAKDRIKKLAEISKENVIDASDLLRDLFILGGSKNVEVFAAAINLLSKTDPTIPLIYAIEKGLT